MSTVARILDAVAKHDPDAARVMAADAWWEEASQARREMFAEQVPLLLHKWEAVGPMLAQRVGREYVVAKSADVDAAFDPRGVLAEWQQLREVLKADDQFRRYGRIVSVNRDTSGRFSRQSSGRSSDPSQWVLNRDPGKDRRAAPANVRSYLQANPDTGRGQWTQQAGSNPDDRRAVTQFLGTVSEVQQLQQDLARTLGRSAVSNYEIVVQFHGASPDYALPADSQDYDWDVLSGPARSFEVRPKSTLEGDAKAKARQQLQFFDNMDALQMAGIADERTLDRVASVMNDTGSIDTPRTRRYASALRVGSQLAGTVGARGASRTLNSAAAALEEGERFRPALTRAAYRYRGTEKRPDPDLVAASLFRFGTRRTERADVPTSNTDRKTLELLNSRSDVLTAEFPDVEEDKDPVSGRKVVRPIKRTFEEAADEAVLSEDPKYGTLLPVAGQRLEHYRNSMYDAVPSTEQVKMAVQRDLVGQAFANRLLHSAARRSTAAPDNRHGDQGIVGSGERNMDRLISDISQRIGRGLPSEGLLIDADGHPIAQSVGLGGDHYQPFTAAALGKLNGGQYIRTRQSGGITADDLRTLLTTNGRAAMVVSGSGVFDIEFDPTFRDQRRMSDKALGMIETYERILDQLAGQGVYARGLTPEQNAEVRQQAKMRSGGDPAKFRDLVESLTTQKLFEGMELSPTEVSEARKAGRDEWKAKYPAASESALVEAGETSVQRAQQDKVRALSLNAEGYEVALRTLQRYYPYFIRDVSYRSLKDLMSNSKFKSPDRALSGAYGLAQSSRTDREYVRPGMARFGDDARAYTGLPNPLSSPGNPATDQFGVMGPKPGDKPETEKPAAVPGGAGGGDGEKPAGEKPAGEKPAKQQAESLPPAVKLMAETATAAMPKFTDQAFTNLHDELGSNNQTVLDAWIVDHNDRAAVSNGPREDPWSDPQSDATIARLASFGSNKNVFNELVKFVGEASEKDISALKTKLMNTAYDGNATGNSNVNRAIGDALSALVDRADAVAAVTTPWAETSMVGFNGQPKAYDFVRAIGSQKDIAELPNSPVVQEAVKQSGLPDGLNTPYSGLRERIAALYDVRSSLSTDASRWQSLMAAKSPQERQMYLQTIFSSKPSVQQFVMDATNGLSDDAAVGALTDLGKLEPVVEATEQVYAAKHLQRQAAALDSAMQWLGGGGGDPKAWEQLLGLGMFQKSSLGKSRSPRLTVTRFLPRNHPVSVEVNKRFPSRTR